MHGLNTYVTGNRTDYKAIIVLYSDVFGLALPNNKLLADSYADGGKYLVYLPDFFQGDPVPLEIADVLIPVDASKQSRFAFFTGVLSNVPRFALWWTRHTEGPTNKVCMDFMASLRRATGDKKIGMVGTCWGGKYAIRAARRQNQIVIEGEEKKSLVDAVVALHPSNLVLPDDATDLVVPVSYGWGLEDTNTKIALKDKIQEIEKTAVSTAEMEHVVYEPGRHGFAVRGNPEDPKERACLERSHKQVLQWFDKHL